MQVRNGILKGESYLQVAAKGGEASVLDNKIVVNKADEVTLYLAAGTNFKNYKDASGDATVACKNALKSLQGKTYDEVKTAHIKDRKSVV